MTKQEETIKTLRLMQAAVEWDYPMDYAAAIDAAIEALEKQIPKKPTVITWLDTTSRIVCPVCGNRISDKNTQHCENCGQAVMMP